jgi:hypothetical protein
MSTINYLTVRNTVLPVVTATRMNYSTLTGSTITATSMNLTSASVALGASTNQTYNNFSNGSYAPPWITAKDALSSTNKTVMSANGLYQMIVGNATSGLFLSSDSGITWTALTGGLPTLTGSAYWSDGAISANGQYITLSIYGGSLWMSADYGRTFALTNQPTPSIWLPLNGNTTDLMGSSTVTVTGSPSYVTLNYPGYSAQAVNLANTAGGTATRYIRGTWPGATNFTVSGWFNPQALTGVYQVIFSTYSSYCAILIDPSNQFVAVVPSGGGSNYVNVGLSSVLSINTWYYFSLSFQTNGTCSLYLNNTLLGSITNTQGVGSLTTSVFELSGYDSNQAVAFNGFIDDLKITNSVSTYVPIPLLKPNIWMPFENSPVDLGPYSVPIVTPTIYLPFEGNVTASIGGITPVATGPVTYVSTNRDGIAGQAIRLTNTAGGTAAQFVRGAWTGAANFTLSGWFNAQAFSGFQTIFSAYSGNVWVMLQPGGQLYAGVPSGGAALFVTVGTTAVLSLNTWYYVALIFQTNGLCSLYVNNVLIGSITNTQGVGTLTTTQFGIGCNDHNTSNAFNGTVDDFRIHNSAIPYAPVSNINVTGSLSYVPGVVGLNAVNLVNPAGGTAANFITVAWPTAANSTISMWFNLQSVAGTWNELFCADTIGLFETFIYVPTMSLISQIPSGGSQIQLASAPIVINTWYHLVHIFQTNGTCSVFLNGVSIGSATNTSGTTGTSWTNLTIGRETATNSSAFNGYIDDLRIYNAAIPYHVLFPQNYRALALSGTGQYALASAASGWVVGSSDSSRTWSKQAVNVGTQSDLVQPNASGLGRSFSALTTSPWTQNGITWIASSSSVFDVNNSINYAFDNSSSGGEWVPLSSTYTTAGNTSGQTTTIQTIGTVTGEWLQIESSVPLIMASYQFATGNVVARTPKTYYIVGNNSGNTWFPIQYGAAGTVTTTPQFTTVPGIITVNSASTQIFGSSTITTTTYATTTNAYTSFRLICLSNYTVSNDVVSLGEWFVNFLYPLTVSRPPTHALSMNHTGQYQLVATGPAAGSIMPNRTGLAAASWTQGGVNWTASASSSFTGYPFFNTFNNTSSSWLSDNTLQRYTNGSPNVNAASTNIQTIGPTAGEWVQIQTSVPLVLTSFAFGIGVNAYPGTATPKIYYIVGSNDGSTWVPLQFGNFTISAFTGISVPINMNTTGTQTLTSTMVGSVATTAYSFTTNAYTYFRLIGTSLMVYGGSSGTTYMEVGEWYMNFSNSVSYSSNYGATWLNTSRTVSNESVALSPSGQYALSTNSVAPLARLTLDNTNLDAQGVLVPTTGAGTVTYPGIQYKVGTNAAFFNNTAGLVAANYLNYTIPSALATPSMLTQACWVYPTAYGDGINRVWFMGLSGPTTNGSLLGIDPDGTLLHFTGTTANAVYYTVTTTSVIAPLNTWTHVAMTFGGGTITLYINGIARATTSAVAGNLSQDSGGSYAALTNLYIGTPYPTAARAYRGYVDDVRIYTSALNADEINGLFRNPALTQTIAVSNSYLPITSYTEPVLPGITANVVDIAVSQTGQYMVAVTSSTTNNVYYSTDFGATFTALTIGTTAMVSCSISYDGTYLTVTNATTTYTLNENTRGFTLAIGNQAGRINQGLNAIAIGDKAGQTNQSNNSIVLNATGTALDAVVPGFYVAPVATADSSSLGSFSVLGYGTDSQVVQTGLRVLQNGSVGIGSATPTSYFQVADGLTSEISGSFKTQYTSLGYTAATLASPSAANGSVSGPVNGVYTFTLNSAGQDALYNGLLPAGVLVQISITVRSPSSNVQLAIINTSNFSYYYLSPVLTNTLTTYTFTARISSSTQLFTRLIGGINGSSWSWSDFSVRQMDTLMTGNVGIGVGTANPAASLDVNGSIISRAQTPAIAFLGDINGAKWAQKLGGYNLAFGSDSGLFTGFEAGTSYGRIFQYGVQMTGTGGMNIKGNVGIGVSNPVVQFHVIGSARIGTSANYADIGCNATSGTVQLLTPAASFNSYIGGYPLNGSTFVRNSIGAYFGTRDGVVSRGCAIDFEDVNTNVSYPTEIRGGQLKFYTCDVVQQGVNASVRMTIAPNGNVGIGVTGPTTPLHVVGTVTANTFSAPAGNYLNITNGAGSGSISLQGSSILFQNSFVGIGTATTVSNYRMTVSAIDSGTMICYKGSEQIFAVWTAGPVSNSFTNPTNSVLFVARDTVSNRSINAAGTFNGNGADYAEYMTKGSDFSAQKGDILGVLPSGKLTNQFDDAIHFLLKSTNPCMVGGDVWGSEAIVGEKPKEPEKEATEEEKEAHAVTLAAWEARLEAERKKVDRMAFAGQVPVNIMGATPGNYIIPLRNADGSIGVAAVSQADMSFSQYQSAVGRVISILEDGRANVIVKAV